MCRKIPLDKQICHSVELTAFCMGILDKNCNANIEQLYIYSQT